MPDSYGHAKSFFISGLLDGQLNKQRNLFQFTNPSKSKPKVEDIVVMKGTVFNKYGHVAIISKISETTIEIIQQNPGMFSSSRETFQLSKTENGMWKLENGIISGWLRK
jgi:surface antigen